jgi:hypothetical protein|tara:strand:- start:150 stop:311 length:162 start_codon:yes stop_codon:yes gene_type:complete
MKLIVLDFGKNITYIYDVGKNLKNEEIETFLNKKGHGVDKCQWMLTKNEIITK